MTSSWIDRGQRLLRTVLPLASILVFSASINTVRAQDLCTNLDRLIDQSRTQFAAITDKAGGETGEQAATLTLAGASKCAVTSKSKRSFYLCSWAFPYREKQAYDTYDAFVMEVNDCIGEQATVHQDQSVNHPDFYALHRYELEQAEVSVSVKDKGALGSTFVFIRVQGGTED